MTPPSQTELEKAADRLDAGMGFDDTCRQQDIALFNDFAIVLKGVKRIPALEAKLKEVERERERLFDLVRYQRAELHQAELISDDEYTHLLSDSKSRVRLESYDDMRKQLSQLRADYKQALEALKGSRLILSNTKAFYVCSNCGQPDGYSHTVNCAINKALSTPSAIAAMKGEV